MQYPSCADSSVLTVVKKNTDRNVVSSGLLVVPQEQVSSSSSRAPPRVLKPIAALPSIQDKVAGKFIGEKLLPSAPSLPPYKSSTMFIEALLPITQISPVYHSGEYLSNSQIHIAL